MSRDVSVGAAILAGGASRRYGSNKALADASGLPMAARVRDAIRGAGIDPVVVVGGDARTATELGLVLVEDLFPGEGPLGATATALNFFTQSHVLVVACDMPLLKPATVAAVVGGTAIGSAAVATSLGEPMLGLGCWPRGMYRQLLRAIRNGSRRWDTLLELGPYVGVEVHASQIRDADDPIALARLMCDAQED